MHSRRGESDADTSVIGFRYDTLVGTLSRARSATGAVRLLGMWLVLASLGSRAAPAASWQAPAPPVDTARVGQHLAPVRAGPSAEGELVWQLYEGTQVRVLDGVQGADGQPWWRIRLWNSEEAWIAGDALAFTPFPPPPPPATPGGSGGPCLPRPAPAAPRVIPLAGPATIARATALDGLPDGVGGPARLPAGAPVVAEAWTVGADGRVRYRVSGEDQTGWAAPGAVALQAADPVTRTVAGRPIAERLRGKGMWHTLDSQEHGADPAARIVRAAAANGLSHLYVEVATSRGGFWGARWLDALLPAARAANLRVIGSVYVCLDDLAADLALAEEVARYRTADGLELDGLTADLEETLVAENVQAFGELLRHALGDDYLLVATVFPPESRFAPRYPWPTLAASWNAVVPMAYWRFMEQRAFTPDEVQAYTRRNLDQVRALAGRPDLPVQMLAQLFDAGRPRLLGPDGPTPAELEAAATAAREAGALGISFFDWTRATPAQWEALARLRW